MTYAGAGAIVPAKSARGEAADPFVQDGAPAPADGDAGAVAEDHLVAAGGGADGANAIDLYDGRPVHAQEAGRVQTAFERTERLAEEVRLRSGVDLHVIAFGGDPVDVVDRNHEIAGRRGNHEALNS